MLRQSRLLLPGITKPPSSTSRRRAVTAPLSTARRSPYSTTPKPNSTQDAHATPSKPPSNQTTPARKPPTPHKTQSQLDQELRDKMDGLSGDGGASGVEYEDGQPVSMKRSVKENMFRYI